MLDLVIRNGLIVDGSGLPAYRGDVGIEAGKLVSVGRSLADATAARTLDASGRVVAPGFIDPHTHVDAQVLFDPYAFPLIEHGVTTVVAGNCSLSMAPVRAGHRARFGAMFRLIEEMPEAAFEAGVDWKWGEEFGGLVEQIERDIALNVTTLVGHSVLRMYVLGDDVRRAATPDEIRHMCDVLRACLDAGAVGLSTSYIDVEDDLRPVPCRWSRHVELEALCSVLGERGRMLQVVHEFFDTDLTISRVEMMGDLSRRYGIPTTLSPLFHNSANADMASRVIEAVSRQCALGARVWPQMQTRPVDISWTFEQRSIMFLAIPGWWPVLGNGTKADKMAKLSDPTVRAGLIASLDAVERAPGSRMKASNFVVREVALDRNRDLVGRSVGDIAAERGVGATELMIDLSVEEDLATWFIRENSAHNDSSAIGPLLADDHVHIGASDAGAHVGSFATYGDTGYLLAKYVRETKAMTLEHAVKKSTSDVASIWGLANRGALRDGFAADVVVFDPVTIDRGPEVASDDFPGDGIRWIRRSVGVDAVVVNGTVTWTHESGYVPDARAGHVSSVVAR